MTEKTTSKFGDDLILRMAARREFVLKNAPSCPQCASPQVRTTDYMHNPAPWKCRDCKHEWDWEPPGWQGTERLATCTEPATK